eukprot:SAG31_NODE_3860_length_3814_cov_2.455720_4_plen_65_part_00
MGCICSRASPSPSVPPCTDVTSSPSGTGMEHEATIRNLTEKLGAARAEREALAAERDRLVAEEE